MTHVPHRAHFPFLSTETNFVARFILGHLVPQYQCPTWGLPSAESGAHSRAAVHCPDQRREPFGMTKSGLQNKRQNVVGIQPFGVLDLGSLSSVCICDCF